MHIVFKSLHKYHVMIYLLQRPMVGVLVFLWFFSKYGGIQPPCLSLLTVVFWVKIPLYLHSNQKMELKF